MQLASTGIEGLDACVGGGLPRDRVYLIEGDPGVGKTTLALQFLLKGAELGETVLLISLAETSDELKVVATSHNWDLSGVKIFDVSPTQSGLEEQYSILQPSEIELTDTIKKIVEEVDRVKPQRVVIDSLSEVRLLSQSPLRYRRQVLALKQHLRGRDCTVMLLDDRGGNKNDLTIQSLVHGVIELQKYSPLYGKARRKLQIAKLRGVGFQAGFHDFNITTGGIEVYPRLQASNHRTEFKREQLKSGVEGLDKALGGGLDRGTSTLVVGPAGTGKSSLALLYAIKSAERGERAVIFTFDEGMGTLFERARQLGMDIEPFVKNDLIHLQQIDPAEMSPGEFMWYAKHSVEKTDAKIVIIDSLNGYIDAMPESHFLTIQMHEMLSFMNQQGVVTILTMAQHGYMGSMENPADVSYLADTVILLRYFEAIGEVRKAISIVKKRSGRHETEIREYQIGPQRISVGRALNDFRGILTGVPVFTGTEDQIMRSSVRTPRDR